MTYTRNGIISAFLYKLTDQFITKGITFVIGIILARLIAPEEYGLLAILNVFTSLSNTLIQTGMNTALLQKKSVEHNDYSIVFYLTIIVSIIAYIIIFTIAPFVEQYYNTDGLTVALRIYSIILILGAYNTIQVTKAVKELRMQTILKSNLIASLLSGAIALMAAYCGMGIWSLVMQSLSFSLISCIAMFFFDRWLPTKYFSKKRAREFWQYGWKLSLSGIINTLYNETRTLIIGKRYSTTDLGLYNRGFQFPYFVASNINITIQTIALPVLSSEQDNIDVVKSYVRRAIISGSYFIIPLMAYMAFAADSMIIVLLGEKWLPAASYVRIFCFAYMLDSMRAINGEAIKSIGESGLFLKTEIVRKTIMVLLLVVSLVVYNTPKAIAISFTVGSIIEILLIAVLCGRLLNYSLMKQIIDILPIIASTIAMICIVFFLSRCIEIIYIKIAVQVVIGIPIYVLLAKLLKCNVLRDIYNMIKDKNK